jgi:hypothetical protein
LRGEYWLILNVHMTWTAGTCKFWVGGKKIIRLLILPRSCM